VEAVRERRAPATEDPVRGSCEPRTEALHRAGEVVGARRLHDQGGVVALDAVVREPEPSRSHARRAALSHARTKRAQRSEGTSRRTRSVTWHGKHAARGGRRRCGSRGLGPGLRPAPARRPPQRGRSRSSSASCQGRRAIGRIVARACDGSGHTSSRRLETRDVRAGGGTALFAPLRWGVPPYLGARPWFWASDPSSGPPCHECGSGARLCTALRTSRDSSAAGRAARRRHPRGERIGLDEIATDSGPVATATSRAGAIARRSAYSELRVTRRVLLAARAWRIPSGTDGSRRRRGRGEAAACARAATAESAGAPSVRTELGRGAGLRARVPPVARGARPRRRRRARLGGARLSYQSSW
jgi:hypothetical protein